MAHVTSKTPNTEKIRELNDLFRKTRIGGKFLITRGILSLGKETISQILNRVMNYNDFTKANDPYGEHDFGNFTIEGNKIFWKIDYYDRNLEFGSEDPADPNITERVLTVLLAGEY